MRFDPRTKLALLFVWALAVFFSPGLPFEAGMMALAVVFGALCGKARLSVAMFAVYCVTMGIAIALAHVNLGIFSTLFNSFPARSQSVPLRAARGDHRFDHSAQRVHERVFEDALPA